MTGVPEYLEIRPADPEEHLAGHVERMIPGFHGAGAGDEGERLIVGNGHLTVLAYLHCAVGLRHRGLISASLARAQRLRFLFYPIP